MTEILTESFCERCGTRYTFESNARRRGFGRVRELSLGLKHFVENDGSSIREAMEAARSDVARSASSEQIDAFHRTFSFCMGCRQYTCSTCWNAPEGMCLTCAPDLSREVLPAPFPDLPLHPDAGVEPAGSPQPDLVPEAWPSTEAWPEATAIRPATLERDRPGEVAIAAGTVAGLGPHAAETAPTAEGGIAAEAPVVEAAEATVADAGIAAEPTEPAPMPGAAMAGPVDMPPAPVAAPVEAGADMTASADALDGQPGHQDALTPAELALVAGALAARSAASAGGDAEPQGPPAGGAGEPRDHAAVGRSQTRTLLGRFRPARPATPTAPVAMTAAPAPVMSAPPIAPPAPSAAAGEPVQAVVAGPEAPPVPVAPPARQAPSTAAATPPSAASREDVVPQPTWSIVAPDAGPSAIPGTAPGTPGRGWPAPAAAGTAASLSPSDPLAAPAPRPVPARPERPGSQRPPAGAVSQWAARLANARPETGVWAESSRGVVGAGGADAPAGIQACVSCGLPLSATARFCRRCGSRQG